MWNYRLVRHRVKGETFYEIHEAYIDKNGKVHSITKNGVAPYGDTRDEVLKVLARMMNDILRAPTLDYNKIPEKGAINPCREHMKKKNSKARKP